MKKALLIVFLLSLIFLNKVYCETNNYFGAIRDSFAGGGGTNLQLREYLSGIEGKEIIGEGYVQDVTDINGNIVVFLRITDEFTSFYFRLVFVVSLKREYREEVSQLKKWEHINFSGIFKEYNNGAIIIDGSIWK
jgi:hypothetical protein